MTDEPIEVDDELLGIIARQADTTVAQPLDVPADAEDQFKKFDPEAIEVVQGRWMLKDTEAGRQRAREMQEKSRGKYREARERRSEESKAEARQIRDTVGAAMADANDSTMFKGGIDKMGDHIVRMMGNLLLNGGDMFVPTSAKEASDIAKQWAGIAAGVRSARAATKVLETTSTEQLTTNVVNQMAEIKTRLEARIADPVKPGRTRQLVEADDDGYGDLDERL